MKNSDYITRVLTHIRSKNRKNQIENELFDHIDEKGKEYTALGYDDDGALTISETAMGDADLVGEQLDSIKKYRGVFTVIGYVVSGILLFLLIRLCISLNFVGGAYSWSGAVNRAEASKCFYAFILISLFLLFCLLQLFVGMKKRLAVNSTLGFIGLEFLSLYVSKNNYGIFYFVNKLKDIDFRNVFYTVNISADYNEYLKLSTAEVFLSLVFAAITAAVYILSLAIIIKTKRLSNTKKDLKLKNALTVIFAAGAVAVSVFTVCVCADTIAKKDSFIDEKTKIFAEYEREFISKATDFAAEDFSFYRDFAGITLTEEMKYYVETNVISDEKSRDVNIVIDYYVVNPFGNPFDFQNIDELNLCPSNNINDIELGSDISEAPLPARLDFWYENEKMTVELYYDWLYTEYLVYEYDEADGTFRLAESSAVSFTEKAELTAEQRVQLTEMLNAHFSGYQLYYCKPYGVYYNEAFDRYLIDLAAGFIKDEPFYTQEDPLNYLMSFKVKFEGGKCVPVLSDEEWFETGDTRGDNFATAENLFNEKSMENFDESALAKRLENEFQRYNDYRDVYAEFEKVIIPKNEEECIQMALEYEEEVTDEVFEALRNKPQFFPYGNDSYNIEVASGYQVGPAKRIMFNGDSRCNLDPEDYQYIEDMPLGLTLEEFYAYCGVFAPFEISEDLNGNQIVTLIFRDDFMWSKFDYSFENGVLAEMEPSAEYHERHSKIKTVKADSVNYWLSDGVLYFSGSEEEETKIAENVKDVQAVSSVVMYLTEDGMLYGFGYENSEPAQGFTVPLLKGNSPASYDKPVLLLSGVESFSVSNCHVLAVDYDGDLYFWGASTHGQSTVGVKQSYDQPKKVQSDVRAAYAFGYSTAFITDENDLYICGDNSHKQVGNGEEGSAASDYETIAKEPYLVLSNVKRFIPPETMWKGYTVMAETYDGHLYEWGGEYSATPQLIY